jgi:hypothetical protein
MPAATACQWGTPSIFLKKEGKGQLGNSHINVLPYKTMPESNTPLMIAQAFAT